MIVRTSIDPAAIRDAVATSDDGGKAVLTRLATELRRHGALVTGSDGQELKEALDPRRVPIKPAVSRLWDQLLDDLKLSGRLIDPADHRTGAKVDLTVSGDPAAAPAGKTTSPELIDRSPAIQRLRQMKYQENYDRGSDSRQIWGERFAPCARISSEATVVDQYLFSNPAVAPWILQRLTKDAPNLDVYLIGAARNDRTVDQIRDQLTNLANGQRPAGRICVWLVPWVEGVKGKPHNRHIRFDRIAAFTLEEGFDRFIAPWDGSPVVWGSSGVTPHYLPADGPHLTRLQSIEDRLKAATPQSQTFLLESESAAT